MHIDISLLSLIDVWIILLLTIIAMLLLSFHWFNLICPYRAFIMMGLNLLLFEMLCFLIVLDELSLQVFKVNLISSRKILKLVLALCEWSSVDKAWLIFILTFIGIKLFLLVVSIIELIIMLRYLSALTKFWTELHCLRYFVRVLHFIRVSVLILNYAFTVLLFHCSLIKKNVSDQWRIKILLIIWWFVYMRWLPSIYLLLFLITCA
jgi:hypothetical protein